MTSTQVVEPANLALAAPDELRGTLTLLSDPAPGTTFVIDDGAFVIGRAPEASLTIDDAGLSRAHARFSRTDNHYLVEDLNSTNGTLVDGQRIEGAVLLNNGARIQLGKGTILRFSLQDRLEQEAAQHLYEQTVRDALTGLHNRRYLEDRLAGEFAFAVRHGTALSVVLLDVDHFKTVNDTYGHQAGDMVLHALGTSLRRQVHLEDVAARYGGEEFILVARGRNETQAMALANRIRVQTMDKQVLHNGRPIPITLSGGVASWPHRRYANTSALIAAADRALYQAKYGGRNQIILSE